MTFIPTEAEIVSTFVTIKNKNSSGYDGISNRNLKSFGKFCSKLLANVFNKSLTIGKFRDRLKYFVVNPLFKKGEKSELTNYRPISLLTGFIKTPELVICQSISMSKITIFLLQNNMVSEGDCQQLMLHSGLLQLF